MLQTAERLGEFSVTSSIQLGLESAYILTSSSYQRKDIALITESHEVTEQQIILEVSAALPRGLVPVAPLKGKLQQIWGKSHKCAVVISSGMPGSMTPKCLPSLCS